MEGPRPLSPSCLSHTRPARQIRLRSEKVYCREVQYNEENGYVALNCISVKILSLMVCHLSLSPVCDLSVDESLLKNLTLQNEAESIIFFLILQVCQADKNTSYTVDISTHASVKYYNCTAFI